MAKKRKNKKKPIDFIQLALEFIVGLLTGIILLIIDRLTK